MSSMGGRLRVRPEHYHRVLGASAGRKVRTIAAMAAVIRWRASPGTRSSVPSTAQMLALVPSRRPVHGSKSWLSMRGGRRAIYVRSRLAKQGNQGWWRLVTVTGHRRPEMSKPQVTGANDLRFGGWPGAGSNRRPSDFRSERTRRSGPVADVIRAFCVQLSRPCTTSKDTPRAEASP